MAGTATHQIAVLGTLAAFDSINGVHVSLDGLAQALPIGRKQIATSVGKLIRRGYAERLETGLYALTLTGRKALADGASLTSGPNRGKRKIAAYRDTLQQRAWAAMRLTPSFTIPDVAMLAAKPEEKGVQGSLQRFFHRLARAGYLAELPRRAKGQVETSPGFKVWRLARNTGEQSPRWIERDQAFRDFNTREVFPCA